MLFETTCTVRLMAPYTRWHALTSTECACSWLWVVVQLALVDWPWLVGASLITEHGAHS